MRFQNVIQPPVCNLFHDAVGSQAAAQVPEIDFVHELILVDACEDEFFFPRHRIDVSLETLAQTAFIMHCMGN